ncbi:MAG: membrane protein insertase YidC [Bdellovibrionaceae bacterium]|nr:membrane protein insertase YidC [Pseudobdellovibrionaceae bacterium]MDW8189348.1 membrane protein insertase YidC [Pseudobdellovibrionaceae bacterium]
MEGPVFDKKLFLLLIGVGLVFIIWQKYLEYKYPEFYTKKSVAPSTTESPSGNKEVNPGASQVTEQKGPTQIELNTAQLQPSERFIIKTLHWEGVISNIGMGVEQLQDLRFTDRDNRPIFYSELPLFRVVDLDTLHPLVFQVKKVEENHYEGRTQFPGGTELIRHIRINPALGTLDITTELKHVTPSFKGYAIQFGDVIKPQEGSSFFAPSMDFQEFVIRHESTVERFVLSSLEEKTFSMVDLFALSSHYFTVALIDASNLLPMGTIKPSINQAFAYLRYVMPPAGSVNSWKIQAYIGPKSYEQLANVSEALTNVIDFGWFSTIGSYLLKLLKWAYSWVGNWGWAIVVLTIIVRILVLPFAIISYKSMKKMQLIQPKLQALRERYKDDPVALNRETMQLMKNEKVNPLGGCLPMLLQMPVFFALYQVLSHSIELYKAPFIFWITDLSVKDPYFVLPILMGVVLYIQQKITPTTMDPQQAKIMEWMPIIFTVFTLGLPSGLTLYILVSTLFALIQQKLFMMERKREVTQ